MRTHHNVVLVCVASLFGTTANADVIRYSVSVGPANGSSGDINARNILYTVYDVGDTTPAQTDGGIQFDYDLDTQEVIGIFTNNFGITPSFETPSDQIISQVGSDSAIIHGTGFFGEILLVLNGDLNQGGRIDIVPFDVTADTGTAGVSVLDLDTLLRSNFDAFGTMFLDTGLNFGNNKLGGPTAADLAGFPGQEVFFYTEPVPAPSSLIALAVAGLSASRRRR